MKNDNVHGNEGGFLFLRMDFRTTASSLINQSLTDRYSTVLYSYHDLLRSFGHFFDRVQRYLKLFSSLSRQIGFCTNFEAFTEMLLAVSVHLKPNPYIPDTERFIALSQGPALSGSGAANLGHRTEKARAQTRHHRQKGRQGRQHRRG